MIRTRHTHILLVVFGLLLPNFPLSGQTPRRDLGRIFGVVADEKGHPVSEAEVDADEVVSSPVHKALSLALTTSSGAFEFNPIRYGTYRLFALKPEAGYPDTKFEIYVENYHEATATISATSPQAFVQIIVGPKAGVLKLTVSDKATQKLVPNPTVVLRRPDTNVWISTSNPEYGILLPPGVPTKLTIQADGYASWTNDGGKNPTSPLLTIRSEEERQMTVELEKAQ